MTFLLEITPRLNRARLQRQLFDRVSDCRTPNCWIIKDPKEANKVIWLREKELYHTGKSKGRLVLVKRLLYSLEYNESPTKHIKNYCGNKWCCNPSHCYVPGQKRNMDNVHSQIDNHILSVEDARKWGLFDVVRQD
jgi:hypothetical protein